MDLPKYLEQTPWSDSASQQGEEQTTFLLPYGVSRLPTSFLCAVYVYGVRLEIVQSPTATDDVLDQFDARLQLNSAEIKKAIASIKIAFGLTTKDLADVLGVERQTIYAWVRGENEPRNENSQRIHSLVALADKWNAISGLPVKKLLHVEWEDGATLFDELCNDSLNLGRICSIMRRGACMMSAGKTPRRSVEQMLINRGLDPKKYNVSDAEFDTITKRAYFPSEVWE